MYNLYVLQCQTVYRFSKQLLQSAYYPYFGFNSLVCLPLNTLPLKYSHQNKHLEICTHFLTK